LASNAPLLPEGFTPFLLGVLSSAFSPDGKKIVTASYDETARIWDAESGKELQKLEGHTDRVNSATFSPDGKKIVTASYNETARIWDAESGKELHKLRGTESIHCPFPKDRGTRQSETDSADFQRTLPVLSGGIRVSTGRY